VDFDQATSAIVPTYARANVAFERGEGCWLTSTTGERYLDFGAGIAVTSVGHAHPHMVATLTRQGAKLWHVSNLYQNPEGEWFARRLVDATFADLVFFTNSGAEANEAAIKMARRRQWIGGHPERYRVLTFEGAFHGRTLATIAAGGQKKYLEGFGPKVEGFDQIPAGDLAAVEAAVGPETAAILIEPIQGEGGVRVIPPAFLRGLREICDRKELMLIFDEVQTGVGRTGRFFAYEHTGVHPDILTSAKGIGGGFPMSACLATADAARGLTVGVHGTTFGGNPLACAVACAVFDVVNTTEVLDGVKARHALFMEGLRTINQRREVFADIRGEGVWLGCELKSPWQGKAADVMTAAADAGLIVLMAGPDVVRIAPSLLISLDEILEGLARLESALGRALA